MVLIPQSREELARYLAECAASGSSAADVDLRQLSSIVEHKPEDMTATVEAGVTLGRFQEQLRRTGQWLPIDPPNAATLTIGDLLAFNWSGPRRFGYGTIRDYLIGIKVALANGEIIKAGGKVVKNVAGYDLCKLFIGAKHTLGIIVEGTFKLRPLPEREVILESACDSVAALRRTALGLIESAAEPVVLDVHNKGAGFTLVVGFAGAIEDVEYQIEIAKRLTEWRESSTAYDERYSNVLSVLPSRTAECIEKLTGARFVARFGNGVIYHDGVLEQSRSVPNAALAARLKQAYDPRGIFCSL